MTLGKRIREIRRRHGLTLRVLGERSHTSVSHLSGVERSAVPVSPETLWRIADGLGIQPSILTDGVDDWDDDKQATLERIMALRQQHPVQSDPLSARHTPSTLPPSLLELTNDEIVGDEMDYEWLEWLASLSYQGRQPVTARGWLELHVAIRRIFHEES